MTRHKSIEKASSAAVERVSLPAPDVTSPQPAELPGASCDGHAANDNARDFEAEEPTVREVTPQSMREMMGVG